MFSTVILAFFKFNNFNTGGDILQAVRKKIGLTKILRVTKIKLVKKNE